MIELISKVTMQENYVACFVVAAIVLYVMRASLRDKNSTKGEFSPEFKAFQRAYLAVYLIMMGADWLQGPYVYALYEHYGFAPEQIGQLFVVGFGTSMLSGSFIGSVADKYGRKMMCLVYALLYSGCCWTKHSPDFDVLLFGRVLGGISTSILFSAFESWLVSEHHSRGYSDEWLSATFSTATSLNGFVAIAAGIVGNMLVGVFGYVAPFDLSWILLFLGAVVILKMWPENYGDQSAALSSTIRSAMARMVHDPRIPLIGCIQSFFEAAMYVFVIRWTPALEKYDENLPHGWVFASFMTAVMIGSTLFGYLVRQGYKIERFATLIFAVAAIALAVPLVSLKLWPRMIGFLLFEVCVGMFWPSLGTMRSCYVPEEVRATLMNFFRIPLNIIVVLVLYKDREESLVFLTCVFLLALAVMCQFELKNLTVDADDRESRGGLTDEQDLRDADIEEQESLVKQTTLEDDRVTALAG